VDVVVDPWPDYDVLVFVATHRSGWATAVADAVMLAGTTPAGIAAGAVLGGGLVLLRRAYRPAMAVLAAVVASAAAAVVLKHVVDRPRPPAALALVTALGPSFPSTQGAETAAAAAALLTAAAWGGRDVRRRWGAVLAVLVVLVGACMVYLGAHWLTDVLAGWLLGGAIGAAVGAALRSRARSDARRAGAT
jgi:membrane-associated phospholipid phosphatase